MNVDVNSETFISSQPKDAQIHSAKHIISSYINKSFHVSIFHSPKAVSSAKFDNIIGKDCCFVVPPTLQSPSRTRVRGGGVGKQRRKLRDRGGNRKGGVGKNLDPKMMKIPARFQRVAAAFQEGGRLRLCESSGSEHSPESSTDLSDLVKSFMERDYYGGEGDGGGVEIKVEKEQDGVESDGCNWSFSETMETLERLFDCRENEGESGIRQKIQTQAELACRLIGDKPSSPGFKRKLMTHFRETGIDAGLCKSKWEKFGRFPAGDYEFIDIKLDGTRYIVEVFLAGEFDIVRPTSHYASLLKAFPQIYVGKVEELKKTVKVMCTAIRESMKIRDLHIPPWRRNGYMQAKWFGSYKRTTNEVPTKTPFNPLAAKKSIGFEALPVKSYHCRGEVGGRNGLKVGQLTAAFNGQGGIGLQS